MWSAEERAEGLEYIHPKPSSHSGRIVGHTEIGKDEDSLISPFDVIGEQLRWFECCAEPLLDPVPV